MNSVVLYRKNHEIDYIIKDDKSIDNFIPNTEFLLSISKDSNQNNSSYFIDVPGKFPNKEKAPNLSYLIVRSLK